MDQVTGSDLLREAVAELYSSSPEEFVERRRVLVARARAAGEASVAKQIAALRKPTRSAWVINQLVRSAPAVSDQLAELGDEFRAAQRSGDGAAIRQLSVRRRRLLDELARQAFTVSGQHSPPVALKDEVTATLGAALADPQFAEQLQAGTLERAVHRDGLGLDAGPALTLLPSPSDTARPSAARPSGTARPSAARPSAAKGMPAPARRAASGTPPARAAASVPAPAGPAASATAPARPAANVITPAADLAAARARAEAERYRQAIAAAEQAVAEADRAADTAAEAERSQDSAVRSLQEQLAEARLRLAEARVQARQAQAAQRQAGQALSRLREHPPRAVPRQS
jgi:hypothetical protein